MIFDLIIAGLILAAYVVATGWLCSRIFSRIGDS